MKDKILAALRVKYKNLGFSDKAIEGVLAYLEQTVTAEDQIDASVNAVEGMLKAFQGEIDRRVTTAVADAKKPADPAKPEGGAPAKKDEPTPPPADAPEWAKGLLTVVDTLKSELQAMKEGKSADTRKQQLETMLKDAPDAYKTREMKAFARMQFKDDDEFNTYLEEVKTDSAAFIQSEANKGLGSQGKPFVPGGDPNKPASKEEVDSVVKNIM